MSALERLGLTLLHYHASGVHEHYFKDVEQCLALEGRSTDSTWIHAVGLQRNDVEKLCSKIGLHPTSFARIMEMDHRPRLIEDGDALIVALHVVRVDKALLDTWTTPVVIILRPKHIISLVPEDRDQLFAAVHRDVQSGGTVASLASPALACALIDAIVDASSGALEVLADGVDALEARSNPTPRIKSRIF
jgi:Mg2+ and Co2+ transporter CorA